MITLVLESKGAFSLVLMLVGVKISSSCMNSESIN